MYVCDFLTDSVLLCACLGDVHDKEWGEVWTSLNKMDQPLWGQLLTILLQVTTTFMNNAAAVMNKTDSGGLRWKQLTLKDGHWILKK